MKPRLCCCIYPQSNCGTCVKRNHRPVYIKGHQISTGNPGWYHQIGSDENGGAHRLFKCKFLKVENDRFIQQKEICWKNKNLLKFSANNPYLTFPDNEIKKIYNRELKYHKDRVSVEEWEKNYDLLLNDGELRINILNELFIRTIKEEIDKKKKLPFTTRILDLFFKLNNIQQG